MQLAVHQADSNYCNCSYKDLVYYKVKSFINFNVMKCLYKICRCEYQGREQQTSETWLFQEKDAWQKDMNNFTELQIVPLKHILI